MPPEPATSKEEILEILEEVIQKKKEEDLEKDKLLIPIRKMQSYYQVFRDQNISDTTLRNYGFSPGGYFCMKYPTVFSYKTKNSSGPTGLIINIPQFEHQIMEEEEDEED